MKYYLIAGEASGDLHGSNLMKEIKKNDTAAEFRFWGGDLMQQQGGTLIKHYKDLSFMGFLEIAKNLKTILGNISFAKKDIADYQPDCVILINFSSFNLRIAEFAKKAGLKVYYYISPQIWAWGTGRVHKIKKYVDKMFVVLPFEKDFYAKYDFETDFVGHPLLDAIENMPAFDEQDFKKKYGLNEKPIIALLPGSRKQEINKMLEVMLSVADAFPGYQFVIAGAPSQNKAFYDNICKADVVFVQNETYKLLTLATAAIVASGTATLETALFAVPEVVVYKGSSISYAIGKRLVKHIKYISLVNLIADREVVKELIQNELTTENLKKELSNILQPEKVKVLKEDYRNLRLKLSGVGASKRTAAIIAEDLKVSKHQQTF